MKKIGFTLAEVLITLGIIGIVAAMTLPTLVQKQSKIEVVSQLKTAYTILYQTVLRSQADNDSPKYWDYQNPDEFPDKYIIPYVKVIKDCGRSPAPRLCYDGSDDDRNKLHLLDGTVENGAAGYRSFIISNGMGIIFRLGHGSGGNASFVKIYVDVNGRKGSTTIGKDVFAFSMSPDWGDRYIFLTGVTGANNSGVNNSSYGLSREKLMSNIPGACSKTAVSASGYLQGDFCSALIHNDGWEIKDDYPW